MVKECFFDEGTVNLPVGLKVQVCKLEVSEMFPELAVVVMFPELAVVVMFPKLAVVAMFPLLTAVKEISS